MFKKQAKSKSRLSWLKHPGPLINQAAKKPESHNPRLSVNLSGLPGKLNLPDKLNLPRKLDLPKKSNLPEKSNLPRKLDSPGKLNLSGNDITFPRIADIKKKLDPMIVCQAGFKRQALTGWRYRQLTILAKSSSLNSLKRLNAANLNHGSFKKATELKSHLDTRSVLEKQTKLGEMVILQEEKQISCLCIKMPKIFKILTHRKTRRELRNKDI